MTAFSLRGVRRICLIGGGDMLVASAIALRDAGFAVAAVLAPRHAEEPLPIVGGTLALRLRSENVSAHVVIDINDQDTWSVAELAAPGTLALCFGPSWIFSAALIDRFEFGMINVNAIPVPRYLGGAHYTWQILHGDRSGGCFFQRITTALDRGELLMRHEFEVPAAARTPKDYFKANFDEACVAMREFVGLLRSGAVLEGVEYSSVDADRLYLPRLRTDGQAYVDWSWPAVEIERFCNAFDDPYPGAMSFVRGTRVHLRDVRRTQIDCTFHAFSAGLVVRRLHDQVVVAARDGALTVGQPELDGGGDARRLLREGVRLVTPRRVLDEALEFMPTLSATGFTETRDAR